MSRKESEASKESEALLGRILDYLQRDRRFRLAIGLALVGALLFVAGRSAYRLLPRHHLLTITGGDIVSNRHHLARLLQRGAPAHDLTLIVKPTSTTITALEALNDGRLDVALVQGGVESKYPNVEQVATVLPELVHLLVKPGITGIGDLKGRSINMGARHSGTREVALTLTRFAGYLEDIDYVETNYVAEQLLALPEHKMPDAIIVVSSTPSYLVELLVRTHHYQVVEIPFPDSLALRHGWAGNGSILAYSYQISPPVPPKNIPTIAVNLQLLSRKGVDPEALSRLLEILYSRSVASGLMQPIDEKMIALPSGYPISAGMEQYLHRNDSLFTTETWSRAQGIFGLVMSFSGMGLILLRWFRGKPPKKQFDDQELLTCLAEVLAIEKAMLRLRAERRREPDETQRMDLQLGELRIKLLQRYPQLVLEDSSLFDRCMSTILASQAQLHRLQADAPRAGR